MRNYGIQQLGDMHQTLVVGYTAKARLFILTFVYTDLRKVDEAVLTVVVLLSIQFTDKELRVQWLDSSGFFRVVVTGEDKKL